MHGNLLFKFTIYSIIFTQNYIVHLHEYYLDILLQFFIDFLSISFFFSKQNICHHAIKQLLWKIGVIGAMPEITAI